MVLRFLLINKVYIIIYKCYYSNIKKKLEYYILSNNNYRSEYFEKQNSYQYLPLNY